MTFTQLVRAESFPQHISWQWRDTFALCILPLIFFNSFILEQLFGISVQVALGDSIFRGILFIAICWLYKSMLSMHWQKYKQAFWRSSLLVVIGAIVLQVVISLTRSVLPLGSSGEEKPSILK
ncbi:hypothetical protein [Acinetobacter gandensis]|uniref:hypothetical protein n=1 Tax=Acinetobacter gandensis TaxID=1443941 RepID=UPI003989514A